MKRLITLVTSLVVISLLLCSCGKVNGYKKKDLVPVNEKPGMSAVQVFVVDHNDGKDITVKIKNLTEQRKKNEDSCMLLLHVQKRHCSGKWSSQLFRYSKSSNRLLSFK